MSNRKQYYGIKFPFTANNLDGFFLDLNEKMEDKVASEILHVILTPKRSRIRKPEFGTDLAKFIFEPNESITWEAVKNEVSESVKRWATNINVNDIQIVKNENDESEIYVRLDYSVSEGNKVTNDSVVIQV